LGTGNVALNGAGALEVVSQSASLASGYGKMVIAGGGSLILNNSSQVTMGNLTRPVGGGLVLVPASSPALGTTEKVFVTAGLTPVNGMVDGSFVAANSPTDSTGDFLTYNTTNGFVRATYSTATAITNGATNGTTATSIFHATPATNNYVTTPTQLYALKIDSGATVQGAPLTLGDGTHTAGLIINSNSTTVPTRIETGVTFAPGSEGAVYVGGNLPPSPPLGASSPSALILGPVIGTNGLTKSGNGTLELFSAQYTGTTTINQGTLQFDFPSSVGLSPSSVINLAGTVLYGTPATVQATVNLTGDGSIGAASTGGPVTFAGSVNGNGHALGIASATSSGVVSFQGNLTNVSQVNVTEGELQANGTVESSGSAPTIEVTDVTNSGQSSLAIASNASVSNAVVLNGGELTGGTYSNGVSTLTGSLSVQSSFGFVVTKAGDLNLAGSIQGSVPLYFQNLGSGTDTISGTANTYTGTTEIIYGKVAVTGNITSSNQVNIGSPPGYTATLSGTGSVSLIDLMTNGKLAPGPSGVGTLSATGLTWNGDGTPQLQFNLGATEAASSELDLGTGALTKGTGSGFTFDFLDSGVAGQDYTLITFGANDTNFQAGDFVASDLAPGLDGTFSLVDDGTTESLTFDVVPEPGTTGLLMSGVLGLCLFARSRKTSGR
jgi:autotransporter-associated beta strand protein